MSSAVRIRRATRDDEASVVGLDEYAVSSQERVAAIADAISRGCCWCAVAGGEVLGYRIDSTAFFHRDFLDVVSVRRDARKQGIAAALIAHFRDLHQGDVFSSCNASNVPAQRMLTSCGFRVCGSVEGLDPGDSELIFRAAP